MTVRGSALLAAGLVAVWAALETLAIALLWRTHAVPGASSVVDSPAASLRDVAIAGVFAGVGLLLAIRRPRNAIGWLFLAIALNLALGFALGRYALDALVAHRGELPAGAPVAMLEDGGWTVLISSVTLVLLLFPEGRLPSPRWRFAVAALALSAVGAWVGGTIRPGPLPKPYEGYENPLGVPWLDRVDGVLYAGGWVMLVVLLAAAVSLVGRFRRARGTERKQYQLFCLGAVLFPLSLVSLQLYDAARPSPGGLPELVVSSLPAFAAALLPVATAIAILRYRLYEMDRVVSRALVYAGLTVILGAAYVGLVLLGQGVFASFAGGSNLAIAVSTLVVAALFLPARSRVQGFVDRRFYRRRYDAQRTLEAFGARLRDEVDLVALGDDLRGAVSETIQPAHVSLWLREGRA